MNKVFNPIIFPSLGISVDPNPVAFSLFGKEIYWYGIIIAFGFALAIIYALRMVKYEGINEEHVLDGIMICAPIAIICAPIYYVLFNLSIYDNVWDMFKIWEGGIAIYGAIIGATVSAYFYCKARRLPILKILDVMGVSFMIGQAIGRWGNFMNREAFGGETTSLFAMEIEHLGERIMVHPTFLYESVWNFIGIILIGKYYKHKKFDGEVFLLYTLWYGFGRSIIEGMRSDSLYLFSTGIRVSQLLAILLTIASGALLIYIRKRIKKGDA